MLHSCPKPVNTPSNELSGTLLRAVPEIILGACIFSDPSTPRTHMESEPPDPRPGHVSALINPAPLWIKYALTPRTSYPPPTPRTHCQQNTPPPQDKKVPAAHPPPMIISETALTSDDPKTLKQVAIYIERETEREQKVKEAVLHNRARRQSGFPTFISCQRQDANVLPERRQSHQGDKLCDVSTVPLVARWPVFLARRSDADGEPHWKI